MRLVEGECGPRQRSVKARCVEGHGLGALVADQVLDELHLVVLALAAEALDRRVDGQLGAHERLVGGDVLAHLVLDAREVVLRDRRALGELEVVVEAVLDGRADGDLHARIELHHRRGEHVGGVVADEPERVGVAVAGGDDLQLVALVQRHREVVQAVADHAHAERGLGQAGTDRGSGVGPGRAVGEVEGGAVGEADLHLPDARSARGLSVRRGAGARHRRRRGLWPGVPVTFDPLPMSSDQMPPNALMPWPLTSPAAWSAMKPYSGCPA